MTACAVPHDSTTSSPWPALCELSWRSTPQLIYLVPSSFLDLQYTTLSKLYFLFHMATKFPRFPDLPVNIQAQIWKHAICNPALPNEFRWAIAGQWLEFQSYAKAKWVKGANVTCERKWHQEFCDRNIGLRSWKGKYRTLQIVDYSRYGGSLSALKEFFNIISTCCRARFVGLEWWKGEIERGDSEFERGFFEWEIGRAHV